MTDSMRLLSKGVVVDRRRCNVENSHYMAQYCVEVFVDNASQAVDMPLDVVPRQDKSIAAAAITLNEILVLQSVPQTTDVLVDCVGFVLAGLVVPPALGRVSVDIPCKSAKPF
jgi:hypothetical protein